MTRFRQDKRHRARGRREFYREICPLGRATRVSDKNAPLTAHTDRNSLLHRRPRCGLRPLPVVLARLLVQQDQISEEQGGIRLPGQGERRRAGEGRGRQSGLGLGARHLRPAISSRHHREPRLGLRACSAPGEGDLPSAGTQAGLRILFPGRSWESFTEGVPETTWVPIDQVT